MKFVQFVIVILFGINFSLSDLILPDDMTQGQYCSGCKATHKGIESFIKQWSGREKLNGVCREKFVQDLYDSSLENSIATCKHLFENYGKEIKAQIDQDVGMEQFKNWLCHEKSYACIGVFKKPDIKPKYGASDDEIIQKFIEKNKDRIKTPHPTMKNNLENEVKQALTNNMKDEL